MGRLPLHGFALRTAASRAVAVAAILAMASVGVGSGPAPVAAADPVVQPPAGLEFNARVLLGGQARLGAWMGIEVHLANEGPPIVGELQVTAGAMGRTRHAVAVDLPTQSAKTYLLYTDPPSARSSVRLNLVAGGATVASQDVQFRTADTSQLLVGLVAEQPERLQASLRQLAAGKAMAPVVTTLRLSDLPDQVPAWAALDRLVWQDADSNELTPAQRTALATWVAQGGRLLIVGGTAGSAAFGGFGDALLPFRPVTTIDLDPAALVRLVGEPPDDATAVTALTGPLSSGTALATSGNDVVAAEMAYGAGRVTILGFDPAAGWLANSGGTGPLLQRVIGGDETRRILGGDDSRLLEGVSRLPSLALPPIGGMAWLLVGYIVLIGPVNYLVLRRLDRREWAWLTMPLLIAVFTVGAYAVGSAMRGADVIVNQIAIVRGGPGATEGSAIAYVGVFSPNRGTYEVEIGRGALVSSPIAGDFFGGDGRNLDIVQGSPDGAARVRDLAIGYGSLRTIRAETAAAVPSLRADLVLRDGVLSGTVTNDSDQLLSEVAVAFSSTAQRIGDLAPGQTADVNLRLSNLDPFGMNISDRILGAQFFDWSRGETPEIQRSEVRRAMIDQLTQDPMGRFWGQIPADGPAIIAFADNRVLDVAVTGQVAEQTGQTMYFVPLPLVVEGKSIFPSALLQMSLVESDAMFMNPDPYGMSMSRGTATFSFRPPSFAGSFAPDRLLLSVSPGGGATINRPAGGEPLEPLDEAPVYCDPAAPVEGCRPGPLDGVPDIELFDRTTGTWARLPHIGDTLTYAIADPARYIDPATGQVLLRVVNDGQAQEVYFGIALQIEGTVR